MPSNSSPSIVTQLDSYFGPCQQVLKQFTSGGGGGGSQSELISLAMVEATKLFDSSGGAASGSKQDAVKGAAMTVMKLLVQSKFSSTTGGGNSAGLGGLMSLVRLTFSRDVELSANRIRFFQGQQIPVILSISS